MYYAFIYMCMYEYNPTINTQPARKVCIAQ